MLLRLKNNMRISFLISFMLMSSISCFAQSVDEYFNISANHYVNARTQQAKQTISEAFKKYPNDPKLKALADKMKEDEKKEDQKKKEEQQKQEQQKKEEQQKKDQQQKEQQQKEQEEKQKEEQQKKDQEKKEQQKEGEEKEKKDQEKKDIPPSVSEKLQQMEMSEEKAKMILEAMKNQEVQYLQQNKRKATKPKQKGKPDW
jgi:outer membrane biosynthesis protein TonB